MAYQGQGQKSNLQQQSKYTDFAITDTREMHSLMECMSICASCAKKCFEEGQKKTASLCSDCAKICGLAVDFKSWDSEFQHQLLDLCAQVSKKCADECTKTGSHHCQECAEACKRATEACSTLTYAHR